MRLANHVALTFNNNMSTTAVFLHIDEAFVTTYHTRLLYTNHVTLTFNNNMSTTDVFLHIDEAFVTTCHTPLLYKLSDSEFSSSLTILIASFLRQNIWSLGRSRTFYPPPLQTEAMSPQVSVLAQIFYSLYINDATAATGTCFVLFADDTSVYKLQRGPTARNLWREPWNIKIMRGKHNRSFS
jgi:membrane-bound metal-dependent hydrolase YbcI (DUF457 family)